MVLTDPRRPPEGAAARRRVGAADFLTTGARFLVAAGFLMGLVDLVFDFAFVLVLVLVLVFLAG